MIRTVKILIMALCILLNAGMLSYAQDDGGDAGGDAGDAGEAAESGGIAYDAIDYTEESAEEAYYEEGEAPVSTGGLSTTTTSTTHVVGTSGYVYDSGSSAVAGAAVGAGVGAAAGSIAEKTLKSPAAAVSRVKGQEKEPEKKMIRKYETEKREIAPERNGAEAAGQAKE